MKVKLAGVLLVSALSLFSQVNELFLKDGWQFRKAGEKEWLPASVPGTVHTDLLANKKIADPFGYQGSEIAWIDTCDWEYRTYFDLDKRSLQNELELVFEGLDTYADVYLNNRFLFKADNMFRSWRRDVKKLVNPGKNELRVKFTSAVKVGKALEKELPYCLPEGERIFTRKAQYHYGWDFAPRFVTCGIWKKVKLIAWKTAKITNVQVMVDSITDTRAVLFFSPEVDCADTGNYEFVLSCKEHKGVNSTLNTPIGSGKQEYGMYYYVLSPQLWWCRGMGNPNLYHFELQLRKDGKKLDNRTFRVGIRNIELVRDKDSIGESFYFKLNGKSVFMKGANLVPPDIFLPRVTKERYRELVDLASRGNMNMLRVWGGGAYCDDSFYDLCDENGILVWQDLMFACAVYPGDSLFTNNVREEVKEQVKRLGSHPCLALWCGNNESDEGWKNWGWQKQFGYSLKDSAEIYNNYLSLFSKTIPDALYRAYLGTKFNYIASSPAFGWGRKESMTHGDSHYWGVWWGMEPFETYQKKVGRFMSEYGFQGMPSDHCIKKYHPYEIKPSQAFLNSRQKHPKGFETIYVYLGRYFPELKSFEDFSYASQLLQAHGLQIAIEAHRRNKPKCMGSLFWQLNDSWPGISWSSLDHLGIPKASYYTAKRSFKGILVSIEEKQDSIEVWITSDEDRDLNSVLFLNLYDFSGNSSWSRSAPVTIEAGSSYRYIALAKKILGAKKPEEVVLKASLDTQDGSTGPATAFYYFVTPKELALQKATVTAERSFEKISLSTNTLAKNVFSDMGPGVIFSDNYFDLLPGEKKIISFKGKPAKDAVTNIRALNELFN